MAKGGVSASGLVVDVLLTIVQIIVFLYDVLSYPIYRFLGKALSQVTMDVLSNVSVHILKQFQAILLTADRVLCLLHCYETCRVIRSTFSCCSMSTQSVQSTL